MQRLLFKMLVSLVWIGVLGPRSLLAQGTPPQSVEKPPQLVVMADKNSCIKEVIPGLSVTAADIGFVQDMPDGSRIFSQTTQVPLVVNTGFGWRLTLNTNRTEVAWEEIFINPAAPVTWQVPSRTVISADKLQAVTRDALKINLSGGLSNTWYFLPGDPYGEYKFRVSLENHFVCEFKINVVKQ